MIEFGKHKGTDLKIVLIEDPSYLLFLKSMPRRGRESEQLLRQADELMTYFDWCPIRSKSCSYNKCGAHADVLVSSSGSIEKAFICSSCFEKLSTSDKGVVDISTYSAILEHGRKLPKREGQCFVSGAITLLYEAKGADFRGGRDEVFRFFRDTKYFKRMGEADMRKGGGGVPLY